MGPKAAEDVRAVVLAGTHQWSAGAFDQAAPRALLPVAGSPLMCYALQWLRSADVQGVVVCANSDSYRVRHRLGDGGHWGLELSYYEDMTPRGPAGCVHDAVRTWPAKTTVVIEGTVIPTFDLKDLLNAHNRSGAALTVVARSMAGDDVVEPGFESAGIYVVSDVVTKSIPPTGYQDIKEMLIPRLHSEGMAVSMYRVEDSMPRVTTPVLYLDVNARLLERMAGTGAILNGYNRVGEAYIHETATVDDTARLYGPVMVGPNTHVGAHASIIGPASIGEDCRVVSHAVVCRSVVWDGARIGARAMVDRCVVTNDVSVPGGTVWHAGVLDLGSVGGVHVEAVGEGIPSSRRRRLADIVRGRTGRTLAHRGRRSLRRGRVTHSGDESV